MWNFFKRSLQHIYTKYLLSWNQYIYKSIALLRILFSENEKYLFYPSYSFTYKSTSQLRIASSLIDWTWLHAGLVQTWIWLYCDSTPLPLTSDRSVWNWLVFRLWLIQNHWKLSARSIVVYLFYSVWM